MSPGRKRILYAAAAVLSLLAAARLAQAFFSQPEADLISWDQASRADEAVRLAKEFRFFEIPRFFVHILSLNWWPPLHPLIMFPFFLILGPCLQAAIIPSLAALVLAILSILFLFENLSSSPLEEKVLAFFFLLALVLTSPLLLSSATWAMLEVFGVGLTYLALGFYFQARRTSAAAGWRACAVLVFLLWTLKYSYGLFLTAILLFFELGRSLPGRSIRKFFRLAVSRLGRPVFYPAYVLLAITIGVAFAGGIKGKVLGIGVSISNIYNPLMYLYLYLFTVFLFSLAKNWAKVKARLQPGQKELVLYGALPLGIFLALPDKIKAIIMNFEIGQQVGAGVPPRDLLFYPRSFFRDYSLWVPVGVLVLALCLLAVVRLKRSPLGVKALLLFSLAGFLSLTAGFRLQEGRYLATFVPALWVTAAWSLETLTVKVAKTAKNVLAGVLFLAVGLVLLVRPIPVEKAIKQPWAAWAHHEPSIRPLVDSIVGRTRDAHRLFISGTQEAGFSPLLGWKLQMAHFGQRDFRLTMDSSSEARDSTSAFMSMAAQGEADMIVFMIARNGKSESLLLKWSENLKYERDYLLEKEENYLAPIPLKLVFYEKKTRGSPG